MGFGSVIISDQSLRKSDINRNSWCGAWISTFHGSGKPQLEITHQQPLVTSFPKERETKKTTEKETQTQTTYRRTWLVFHPQSSVQSAAGAAHRIVHGTTVPVPAFVVVLTAGPKKILVAWTGIDASWESAELARLIDELVEFVAAPAGP